MLPALVDTHCHLTSERFVDDLDAVIARAQTDGIYRAITIGTGIADGRRCLELTERFPGYLSCAIGIDPFHLHQAGTAFDDHLAQLDVLLASGRFCAVGEIGLEYFHRLDPKEVQIAGFERQLALAVRHNLPVVIHSRDAHGDVLACLRRNPKNRGVIHSFTGTRDDARAFLDLGWHLSLNGMLTFKANDELRAAAALIPNDRLLVETDSPYLSPVPMRGKRCEPAFVAHTVQLLAEVRGQRPEDVAAWTTRNAGLLFRLPKPVAA